MFQRSRSGGPDTVPSTAYEQQLETPMNIKHTLRGRFWTQLRIQNSACRRFTMPPFTFRSIRRHRTPSKKKEKGWVGGTKQKQVDTRRRGTTVIAFTFKRSSTAPLPSVNHFRSTPTCELHSYSSQFFLSKNKTIHSSFVTLLSMN